MPTYTYVQNASGEVLYADANGQPQGIDAITWDGTNLTSTAKVIIGAGSLTNLPTIRQFAVAYDSAISSGTPLVGVCRINQTVANPTGTAQGFEAYGRCNHSTGTVLAMSAGISSADLNGAGTVTSLRAHQFAVGIHSSGGSGTVTNCIGAYVGSMFNLGGGTITTTYSFYAEKQTVGGTNWGLYLADTGNDAYIGGDLTLGENLAVTGTAAVTGVATLGGSSAGELRLLEPSAGGTSYIALKAPALAANVTWTLPAADGTSGQFLKTDGAGSLSFATISGGGDALTTNPLSQFASTTSAQLAGVISDETGTGALVFANTPTLVTPVLGTPTSGTLTNCTGLPISTGVSGLGTGVATFLATPNSANLAAAVTDETGSGALMFGTSPTITTDITIPNTGLHLLDTDSSHDLIIAPGSNLTADRTLTITTGDADRTLTISASATISGTNTGDVTLSGTPDYITIANQVITVGLVDLAADVTGDLPLANLAQASAASKLLGRGSAAGAGDYQEITLGTGLSMSGTTLSASGSSTVIPGLFQARLTLAEGIAEFVGKALTPSATDTSADTCDFSSAHGWTTGTMVTVSATAGGLSTGTTYYIRAVDTDTISFHTTLADAEANTSKVNLTASITATITAYGVSSTTLRITKFQGDQITLPVSGVWTPYTIGADITLALGTLTSDKNYDVFLKSVTGTPTLSLSSAWTSDTVRADALSTLNGVRVLNSDTDKVLVGTIRTISTTATVFSIRQAYVSNEFNRLPFIMYREDTGSHTPGTTEREWNGGTTVRCEFVSSKPHAGTISFSVRNTNASGNLIMYAGFDAANLGDFIQLRPEQLKLGGSTTRFYATEGYHYTTIREKDFSTGGTADFGYNTTLVFL